MLNRLRGTLIDELNQMLDDPTISMLEADIVRLNEDITRMR